MGLQGLAQLLQTVELVRKRLNPRLQITGILPCRLDQRTNHGNEIVAKLRARFPETLRTNFRENINPTSAGRRKWQVFSDAGALQVVGCQQTLPLSGDVVPTYPLEMNGDAWA
jgi:cellulose biosynthesis protein BcsQ